MTEERLEQMLARLEDERTRADQLYNTALTALDRSLHAEPDLPGSPAGFDDSQVNAINLAWNILPDGGPPIDGSLRGRLRGFVWRLVGPALEQQRGFNAALVDHLNRNLQAHRDAGQSLAALVAVLREHFAALVNFQQHLIQYLQTITLYVDTKDRSTAAQAQVLNAAIGALTDDWLKRWESLAAREQRFNARVSAVDSSVEDLRASVALSQQTSLTLKREVERLIGAADRSPHGAAHGGVEAGVPIAAPDLNSFKYLAFEDAFRGSQDQIRGRLAGYVHHFSGLMDVLDVGCGRGEFLDLLRRQGIQARGLDTNHEMVEVCRAQGFDVVEADALGYLAALDDDRLGGVFAAQVVEHLEPAYLMQFIETAFHKIRPGGVIVLETINAACWTAFFDSYIRDLTHVRPLHPDTLQYLVRVSGFQNVQIAFTSPVADRDRLQALTVSAESAAPELSILIDTFPRNVATLNARMFTSMDYAAIGRK
jgi:SAM-dependent methyltransferase